MGIPFTRIRRLFNHQEHKVIIVGLDNAGKTILYQFSVNEVVHTSLLVYPKEMPATQCNGIPVLYLLSICRAASATT
uniref:Uncharacterized protein n=1 Tax=Prolemur simus TaxID=1328070 RepID=A0A8C8ZPY9_PROSS